MIARLILASIRNRFLVLLATVMLTAWGLWAVRSTPSAGFLCPCAMINAWQTSSARMCDSIAQPITRREHRSITTAR